MGHAEFPALFASNWGSESAHSLIDLIVNKKEF